MVYVVALKAPIAKIIIHFLEAVQIAALTKIRLPPRSQPKIQIF